MTLKPRDRKPPDLGPKVRVESARLAPAADESGLEPLINGLGLLRADKDGFRSHDTESAGLWRGAWSTNLSLEFELPEAVPLSAVEVWNYNGEWETDTGVRRADVAVSADGVNWQTVLRGAELTEAEGTTNYEEPTVLKLNGVAARKVRFEHLVPWGTNRQVGLSEIVFHQAAGPKAAPRQPEDGALGVGVTRPALEWTPGLGAAEHRVYFGTAPDNLALLGTTRESRFAAPELKPGTTCFWRVDEVQGDGGVATGRVARFEAAGLVAWWKLDESGGAAAKDSAGHQPAGRVQGQPRWTPGRGQLGGALEFDGNENSVNCGTSPAFDFKDAMTVSAWIKVRKFDKPWQAIVTKGETAWRLQRLLEQGNVAFVLGLPPSRQPGTQGRMRAASKRNVDDGQWHHVVGVFDGRRASLYLDGELEDSTAAIGMNQNTEPVMIGDNSMAGGRSFNGWIGDVRLYSSGLSEMEVKSLYQDGLTGGRSTK